MKLSTIFATFYLLICTVISITIFKNNYIFNKNEIVIIYSLLPIFLILFLGVSFTKCNFKYVHKDFFKHFPITKSFFLKLSLFYYLKDKRVIVFYMSGIFLFFPILFGNMFNFFLFVFFYSIQFIFLVFLFIFFINLFQNQKAIVYIKYIIFIPYFFFQFAYMSENYIITIYSPLHSSCIALLFLNSKVDIIITLGVSFLSIILIIIFSRFNKNCWI